MIDQVQSTIIEYLAGRFSAAELATRLPDPWELDDAVADAAARDMALRAVGYLAELERNDRSEGELREALVSLVVGPEPATSVTMTSTKTTIIEFGQPAIQLAGTPRREVPA